eukprot:5407240-Prymnesium_polylepis.1
MSARIDLGPLITAVSPSARAPQLSPAKGSSKMELLEADSFVLQSFDTLTGLKFFVTADPDSKKLDQVLREVYELYSDYVLKVRPRHRRHACERAYVRVRARVPRHGRAPLPLCETPVMSPAG